MKASFLKPINLVVLVVLLITSSCGVINNNLNKEKYAHLKKAPRNTSEVKIDIADHKFDYDSEIISDVNKIDVQENDINQFTLLEIQKDYNNKSLNNKSKSKVKEQSVTNNKSRELTTLMNHSAGKYALLDSLKSNRIDPATVIIWLLILILVATVLSILRIDLIGILIVVLFCVLIILLLEMVGVHIF